MTTTILLRPEHGVRLLNKTQNGGVFTQSLSTFDENFRIARLLLGITTLVCHLELL